jgi:mono/diheme cytochrome c family protein
MKKLFLYALLSALVLFGLIQLVPYGRNHINPSIVSEPKWDSPQTRQMAQAHCFACHSNETQWPWYSNIAPASWLIYHDVVDGRRKFNFSDWNTKPARLGELVEAVQEGEMPPIQYWFFHPGSRLNATQKQAFIQGLTATLNP